MTKYRLIDTGSSGQGWSVFGAFRLCLQRGVWSYPWVAKYGLADFEGRVKAMEASRIAGEVEQIIRDESEAAMPLKRGSVLHTGIAHLNALRMVEAGVDADLKAGEEYYSPEVAMSLMCDRFKLSPSETDDLLEVYKAYNAHYKYDTWQPIAVERFVEYRVAGYRYTMRIDLIVRDSVTHKVFVVDTKTSFSISESTADKYTLSGQFIALDLIGAKLYGADFGGTYTNLLPSSLEGAMAKSSAEARFRRVRRPPTPAITAEAFRMSIKDIGDRVQSLVDGGRDIDSYPRAYHENICITNYGKCEFFDRCQWG